ncbi:HD domain-containing phosphohydrolase [Chitinibacter sp. GC72]|uniref:HD domain-containing phosphohydrolase n=1 Tax=Chitinibacter sp. GC72 TaxID=1526917 RepID=UPI0012F7FB15|nr:HD domain-containing phosphohydrolase [Chitinibacter sp. GC72]
MNTPLDIAGVNLINPAIEDWNAFQDFKEGLADHAPQIEALIAKLKQEGNDKVTLTNLFREFHNIKGDAGLCRVTFVIPIMHCAETLLSRLRDGEIRFTDGLAEIFLLTLDRIEQATELLAEQQNLAPLALTSLANGLHNLAHQTPSDIDAATSRLIEAVTGFKPGSALNKDFTPAAQARSTQELHQDLIFFREMAMQLEARSALFHGRTARNLGYALATNKMAGNRVDPEQLEAAVYLHDIGMMFLPESQWLKPEKLSPDAIVELHKHPRWGAEIANRFVGWQAATQMILQHHETITGNGYPHGLSEGQICDGAKILAIVDAFEAILLKHSHRGQQKSTLRAIAEINACDRQFAAEWVQAFNQVIRKQIEDTQ